MRIVVFNIVKSVLELVLHAYLPWLDPLRYLDISRSVLLSRDGYVKIKRKWGPFRLPLIWHASLHTSIRSIFPILLSILVFLLNQGAFEVITVDATSPAIVLTCDRNAGQPGMLNSREGITHLFRVTASCRHWSPRPASPSWGDAKLEGNKILYGSKTFRCRNAVNPALLNHVDFCYNGNYQGDKCEGNDPRGKSCDVSMDDKIKSSGIQKEGTAVLCTHLLDRSSRLFWAQNSTHGVKIVGITNFAPTTLEILRRALQTPSSFLRSQIRRALDAEATVRDRPFCRRGVRGRVQNGVKYSMLVINKKWWFANGVLALLWVVIHRSSNLVLDFSTTAICDRLRAEAIGDECLRPRAMNFLFGVAENGVGDLHLGPLVGGVKTVTRPSRWGGRSIRGRHRGRRKAKKFGVRFAKLQNACAQRPRVDPHDEKNKMHEVEQ